MLLILVNLAHAAAGIPDEEDQLKSCLEHLTSWYDDTYLPIIQKRGQHPALHDACAIRQEKERCDMSRIPKAMLFLLSQLYHHDLKTEDVLELTGGNRLLALECVLGILDDEALPACQEKLLVFQMCRLLRGFTYPAVHFASSGSKIGISSSTHAIDAFCDEITKLKERVIRSGLLEKLSTSLQVNRG